MSAEVYQQVLGKILTFLSYRPRTRKELKQKVDSYLKSNKHLDSHELGDIKRRVLDYLEGAGLINDEEFAKLFIDSKSRGKSALGRRAIMQKLVQKGISQSDAERYLGEFLPTEDEVLSAQEVLTRKFKSLRLQAGYNTDHFGKSGAGNFEIRKTKDSMIKYLMGRGFSIDIARQAVDYLLKRP